MNGERINYVFTGEYFVGVPVNISGVVIQAKSLEELQSKALIICNAHLKMLMKLINEQPFKLVEVDELESTKQFKELRRYKELFGELPTY
jgi:hypothetical protein